MLLLNDLSQAVAAYQSGSVGLNDIYNWFDRASDSYSGESPEVQVILDAVDSLFGELRRDELDVDGFRRILGQLVPDYQPLESVAGHVQTFDSPLPDVTKFVNGPPRIFPYASTDKEVYEPSHSVAGASLPKSELRYCPAT